MADDKVKVRVRSKSARGFNRAGYKFTRDWQVLEVSPDVAARLIGESNLDAERVGAGADLSSAQAPESGPVVQCPSCGHAARASTFAMLSGDADPGAGAELMPPAAHAPGLGVFPGRETSGSSSPQGGVTREQVTPRERGPEEDTAAGPADPAVKATAAAAKAAEAEALQKAQAAAQAPAVVVPASAPTSKVGVDVGAGETKGAVVHRDGEKSGDKAKGGK